MNIFKKLWYSIFPKKETKAPAIQEEPITVLKEEKIKESPKVEFIEVSSITTLLQARNELSNEWNRPKRKNISSWRLDNRVARSYDRIETLYSTINQFKLAQYGH